MGDFEGQNSCPVLRGKRNDRETTRLLTGEGHVKGAACVVAYIDGYFRSVLIRCEGLLGVLAESEVISVLAVLES